MSPIIESTRANLLQSIEESQIIVVGAGMFGLTIAERVATQLDLKVSVLEVRSHIGGNAYSYFDKQTGIEIHKYGSHLFHTSSERVWSYINQFTTFNNYRHRVFAQHKGNTFSIPVNLHTISQFYGKSFTPLEARELIASEVIEKLPGEEPNFETEALARVGTRLYEAFFHGYTLKQWETNPKDLPASVFSRLPVRYDYNLDYFSDKYQGLPSDGYGALFENMIMTKKISVFLETDFFDYKALIETKNKLVVYTGPMDRYFSYSKGMLGWRTLDFEIEVLDVDDYQGSSVINYVDLTSPFTRIHEFKHLHPERKHSENMTVIMREFSRLAKVNDEPYYPINAAGDRSVIKQYRELSDSINTKTLFGGRLGSYQYLDMHMAIGSALVMFENEIATKGFVR